MIGIYQDSFISYLKDILGDKIKISSKNIITPCPWCEYKKDKDHYHLYISLEAPIFHCFHANCEQSGLINKLIKKLEGKDISSKFIDNDKIKEFTTNKRVFADSDSNLKKVYLPALKEDTFPYKNMYLKKRLKFSNISPKNIKGLIYDSNEFISHNIVPDQTILKLKNYLYTNFIGFLTENQTTVIFRNVKDDQSMRYYKLKIQDSIFLDYYKIPGPSFNSNTVVLAEGIFDIFSAYLQDHLNIKNKVKLYATALSSKYLSVLQSIVFYEQIFRLDVVILSDNGIPLNYYKKLKKYNSHIINSLTVYYNKAGKDFGSSPVIPIKFVL